MESRMAVPFAVKSARTCLKFEMPCGSNPEKGSSRIANLGYASRLMHKPGFFRMPKSGRKYCLIPIGLYPDHGQFAFRPQKKARSFRGYP